MSNNCPCGSLFLPKGSKYDPNGLSVKLITEYSYVELDLNHNVDSFLTNGESFVTTSETIPLNQNITQIILNIPASCVIQNGIKIVIRSFLTKDILYTKFIGKFGDETAPINNQIELHNACYDNNVFNLYNDKLQIELYSICDFFDEECCDATPTTLSFTNKIYTVSLPCCSTTTTPPPSGACCDRYFDFNTQTVISNCLGVMTEDQCGPYENIYSSRTWTPNTDCENCAGVSLCELYNLPNSFSSVFIGGGVFSGQETELLFSNSNGVWSASGYLPCGNLVNISFYCDPLINKFVYDGSIDCCDPSTKHIIDPQPVPIFLPNERPTNTVIWYDQCISCNELCNVDPICDSEEFIMASGEPRNQCCITIYDNGQPTAVDVRDLSIAELDSIGYDYWTDDCVPLIVPVSGNLDHCFRGLGKENNKLCSEVYSYASCHGLLVSRVDGYFCVGNGMAPTTSTSTTTPLPSGGYETTTTPNCNFEQLCLWITKDLETTTTTTSHPTTTSSSTTSTTTTPNPNGGGGGGGGTTTTSTTTTTPPLEYGWYLAELRGTTTTPFPDGGGGGGGGATTTSTTTTGVPPIPSIVCINCNIIEKKCVRVHAGEILQIQCCQCENATTTTTPPPVSTTTTTTNPNGGGGGGGTTTTSTTSTTTTPAIVCIFYADYDENIHTIIDGPFGENCSGTPPPPPPTTTPTPTTTTIIPANPGPGGPNGPGGGPFNPPNPPVDPQDPLQPQNPPPSPPGPQPPQWPGFPGGGGWPPGGNRPPVNPPGGGGPCGNVQPMGNQYPAGVTEQDLINNGYQKLVNASKKFPNNSNTWGGIWRACDDVAQKKCKQQFQNNPFVKLRNGIILNIDNLIKKIRDNVDIGDVVGAIVDRFPDMADILKNNLITFAAAPPPLSLTDKGRAITALEGLKNCLEANCKKRLYLNIGRPIGGQCFKEFEYVPSPNLKNGPEGCRTLGICCLIDKEDCVSQISRLSCIILAEDENGMLTNFEWHKTDINCEDPENIWCPPPPTTTTNPPPPSGTTTTSTTSSTTTTTIPPSGSTTTTTSTIAPSGTTTTTTGTTTPNPFAQCASCDWPAMSSNMFLSEYYSLYNGYGLRSGIYENPPSTKNGVSWSYSQTLPPYTNWSLRQVYESVTDSLDQLDLTYTRSKYSLLACSGTGIIDITDSYVSFTGSPMGCYGADNPLDFREVTMNGSGACPDDWNTYVGHIPSLPSSGLLEYGMFC